jgi:hypothetical protein
VVTTRHIVASSRRRVHRHAETFVTLPYSRTDISSTAQTDVTVSGPVSAQG